MQTNDYNVIIKLTLGSGCLYYKGTRFLVVNDPADAARFLTAEEAARHFTRAASMGGTPTACDRETEIETFKKTLV